MFFIGDGLFDVLDFWRGLWRDSAIL